EIKAYKDEGRSPHWRFKLSGNPVIWMDMVRGEQKIETGSLSDPILIRGDGSFLYTLPSVVDDIEQKITHVIRGEDHVTNSGAQIEIFQALSTHLPKFAHTPLLVGHDGKSLSKRLGSLSMEELKEQGLEPLAICSLLAKIGTSDAIEARPSMDVLKDEFAFSKIGRAPARFSEDELLLVNGKLLNDMPYVDVQAQLESLNVGGGEDLWNLIRSNVTKVNDAAGWSTALYSPMSGQIKDEDKEFCAAAASSLPDVITDTTWSEWTSVLKAEHGRKGKTLFMPLRKALSGRDSGPEMGTFLTLLGAEKAKGRLRGETA
ncbi:MAG: glutamate--tRNA ligase family protein, partial [Litorimonas sp.]